MENGKKTMVINISNIDENWLEKWGQATKKSIVIYHTLSRKCIKDIGVMPPTERNLHCNESFERKCKQCWTILGDLVGKKLVLQKSAEVSSDAPKNIKLWRNKFMDIEEYSNLDEWSEW